MEGVFPKVHVPQLTGGGAEGAFGAIGLGVVAKIGEDVAVGEQGVVFGFADVDGGDAGCREGKEFVGLTEAVLVEVLPEAEICEVGVVGIHQTVGVGVLVGKRGKAIGGVATSD